MLVCKNCGAKLADHSKHCYACHAEVAPDFEYIPPMEETHRVDPTKGSTAKNIWQEKYGAGTEEPEQLDPTDPNVPHEPEDPLFWLHFDEIRDEASLEAALERMEEQQKKAKYAPTDEMLYIGGNSFSYILKFHKLREGNKVISWNWWAFLCGPMWFAFRKMYGLAALLVGASIWISLYFQVSTYYYVVTVILDVLMGLFADSIYMNHIDSLVRKSKDMDREKKAKHIKWRGGTSVLAMFLVLIIEQIISYGLMNMMG